MVKSLPAQQETWIRSLGWEDPLEKEMATNTSILAWAIPCIEEPGGLLVGELRSHMLQGAAKNLKIQLFFFLEKEKVR